MIKWKNNRAEGELPNGAWNASAEMRGSIRVIARLCVGSLSPNGVLPPVRVVVIKIDAPNLTLANAALKGAITDVGSYGGEG